MLLHRLQHGLLMGAAVVGSIAFDRPWTPFNPVFLMTVVFLVWVACDELVRLLERIGLAPRHPMAVRFACVAVAVSNWHTPLLSNFPETPNIAVPLLVFVATGMAMFLVTASAFDGEHPVTPSLAAALLVIFYVTVLSAFLFQLRWLGDNTRGAQAVLLAVFTAKASDMGAYAIGRLLGRTPLWPKVSPAKTVEGSLGGVAGAILFALLLGATGFPLLANPLLTPVKAVLFGLAVAALAQIGDLMESVFKRESGFKDAGDSIPGFGGLLDVADSVLFSAPVAYGLLVGLGWGMP